MNDFFHFLANNFRKAKDGDRFFFTHTNQQGSFTRAARKKLINRTLAGIICDNTDIGKTIF